MMKSYAKPLAMAALSLALAGCAGQNYGAKQGFGTLAGAAAGGLLGAQVGGGSGRLVSTAVGTLAGAMIGNSIGDSLDKADQLYAKRAQNQALEHTQTGYSTSWHNPDTGHSGTYTPTRTYRDDSGRYCREYQHTVIVGGRPQDAYGQACRQPDGSWLLG